MSDYLPTSTLGLQLQGLRYMVASSPAFQSRRKTTGVKATLPYVTFEDPYKINGWNLPEARILRASLAGRIFSAGSQPKLWPEAEHVVYIPFYPSLDYHKGSGKNINSEWLEAQDFGGLVCDDLCGDLNGADIEIPGDDPEEDPSTVIALPSVVEAKVDVYDSLSQEVARDISYDTQKYEYFYFLWMQLRLQP